MMINLLVVGTWQSGRVTRTAKFFLSRIPKDAILHLLDIPPFESLNDYVANHTSRFTIIGIPPLDYNELISAVGHIGIRIDHTSGVRGDTQTLNGWGEEHPESYAAAVLTEYALQHIEEVHLFGNALHRATFRVWSRAAANSIPVNRLGLDT